MLLRSLFFKIIISLHDCILWIITRIFRHGQASEEPGHFPFTNLVYLQLLMVNPQHMQFFMMIVPKCPKSSCCLFFLSPNTYPWKNRTHKSHWISMIWCFLIQGQGFPMRWWTLVVFQSHKAAGIFQGKLRVLSLEPNMARAGKSISKGEYMVIYGNIR